MDNIINFLKRMIDRFGEESLYNSSYEKDVSDIAKGELSLSEIDAVKKIIDAEIFKNYYSVDNDDVFVNIFRVQTGITDINVDKIIPLFVTVLKPNSNILNENVLLKGKELDNYLLSLRKNVKKKEDSSPSMILVEKSDTLSHFFISPHPITQGEYLFIAGNNPSFFHGFRQPVENVSFIDAIKYCNRRSYLEELEKCYFIKDDKIIFKKNKNGYRLLTQDEWFFCASFTQNEEHFLYSGSNDIDEVAWYRRNSSCSTHDVCSLKPNSLFLYDMSGNVREWVWTEDEDKKNALGGFWGSKAKECEIGENIISSYHPLYRDNSIGFRVARSKI